MILTVGIRGNGGQLADYVLAMGENDHVQILEIDGYEEADESYLRETVMAMELNSELTKTDKAFFHAQINPAYGEDKAMTRDDWYKAADMLAEATGYENQRRVIVLHTKKDRIHAHVVWERYNHETGKMIANKNSVYKTNDVRPKIEDALNHKRTNHRNPNQAEVKQAISHIWHDTATGQEFIKEVRKAGYMVAAGTGSKPFMVVDENGRSFNLVRQIDGAKTKDVRARLRNEKLITDKQAIELMREQASSSGKREKQELAHKPTARDLAKSFANNLGGITDRSAEEQRKQKLNVQFGEFKTASAEISDQPLSPTIDNKQQRKEEIAAQFADNRQSAIDEIKDQEKERQKIIAEQERLKQCRQQRKPHR
jgi:hypothetical protein